MGAFMDNSDDSCGKCGGRMEPVVGSRVGAMETWRCVRCGAERRVLLVFVEPELGDESMSLVDLVIWWRTSPPAVGELAALRRAFPQFASMPPSELRKRTSDGNPRFVIGSFEIGRAKQLQQDVRQSGLDVRVEPHANSRKT